MIFSNLSIYLSVFLTGLYGGVGLFVLMGGNPALDRMGSRSFVEYWQLVDRFMAARMPVFGPAMLLMLITTIVLNRVHWNAAWFWFIVIALVILIIDLVFTLSTNHPLNRLIQSWDLERLPSNVREVQDRVVDAFHYRSFFMIACFVAMLLALGLKR